MKILIATMSLDIGGAETHVVELATALRRRGHDVTVASNGGVYVPALEAASVRHCKIPLHSKNPLHVLRAYIKLHKLIKREGFDIVHAHARIPSFICGLLARRMKFRLVTTCHGVYAVTPYWQLFSDWGERSLAVSCDVKDYLIKNYGVCSDSITVTINGIDANRFTPSPETRYEVEQELALSHECDKRVIFVGRIDDESSFVQFRLLEAAPFLREAFPKLEILIIGAGTAFSRLQAEAERVNSAVGARVIILTGARTDIARLLSAGDAFVGVSRAALEAMAAGLPVILAGSRGYSQGYIGIFGEDTLSVSLDTNFCCRGLPDGDAVKLGNDIISLFSSSARVRADMSEYNRAVVQKYFSVSRMADDAEAVYTSLRPYKPYKHGKVVISGYYGFGNTGDDSLLAVIIARLRSIDSDMAITVLSKSPAKTARLYNVRAINRVNIFKIRRELKSAALLINGSGNLIQNGTSTRSLVYYTAVMRMAKRAGVKIMMYASGIGPIMGDFAKKLAARAIKDSDVITLRENISLDVISELGCDKSNVAVTADPAYLIEPPSIEWCDYIKRREGLDKPYFVIVLREWDDVPHDYEKILTDSIQRLSEKYDLMPVFAVMQRGADDGITARVSKYCGRAEESQKNSGAKVLPALTASELTAVLKNATAVIGMRLHILIYAAVAEIPFVGLAYDIKIKAMADEFGLDCLDVRSLTAERLFSTCDRTIANRAEIIERVKAVKNKMREKAMTDVDYVKKLLI